MDIHYTMTTLGWLWGGGADRGRWSQITVPYGCGRRSLFAAVTARRVNAPIDVSGCSGLLALLTEECTSEW